jgi:hypothetical protein
LPETIFIDQPPERRPSEAVGYILPRKEDMTSSWVSFQRLRFTYKKKAQPPFPPFRSESTLAFTTVALEKLPSNIIYWMASYIESVVDLASLAQVHSHEALVQSFYRRNAQRSNGSAL